MDRTPLVYSERFSSMDYGPGHPFRGSRFTDFMELAEKTGFLEHINVVEPDVATVEHLLLAHDQSYLDRVDDLATAGGHLSPDTPLDPGVPLAARRVVGGTLRAGELAVEHGIALGFGGLHHAARNRGGGFCVYNDVAVLAEVLKQKGYKRILNLDTDAHNGDGTMDIFYNDPEVLYISLHQDPDTLYPGRGHIEEVGAKKGKGFTVNIPMPPRSLQADYERAFEELVFPITREFKPDVVIRNGGSDPGFWDDLTWLGLNMEGFRYLGASGKKIAKENNAPLVDLALSGYGRNIPEGWMAMWAGAIGLEDFELPVIHGESGTPPKAGAMDSMISTAKDVLSAYWTL